MFTGQFERNIDSKNRIVLPSNIKNSLGTKNGLIDMAYNFTDDTGKELTFTNFVNTLT